MGYQLASAKGTPPGVGLSVGFREGNPQAPPLVKSIMGLLGNIHRKHQVDNIPLYIYVGHYTDAPGALRPAKTPRGHTANIPTYQYQYS